MTKHLQKFTAILLAVIMTLGVFTVVPFTASAATSGDFEYWILDDGTTEITGYTGTDTELTIPSKIDGKPLTSIGDYAFAYCDSLTSVTILDSVTSIGNRAFFGCEKLTSITIPDSVTSIGELAFYFCTNLASITIPNSVTSIGYDAFYDTAWYDNQLDGLVYAGKVAYTYKGEMPENTSLIIKDGTKSIGDYAFENCGSLTRVTIPDSVTSIGNYAFYYCRNLSSITIPDSVTSIGDYAFLNCTSLTSITIPNSVTSIGWGAFGYYTTPPGEGGMAALPIENFTIYGYKGTAAEKYANENGFKFIVLDDTSKPSFCDIDGDGKISVNDVTDIQKYIVQLKPFTDEQIKFADVDKNGKIDVNDVTLLQKVIVKIAVI